MAYDANKYIICKNMECLEMESLVFDILISWKWLGSKYKPVLLL